MKRIRHQGIIVNATNAREIGFSGHLATRKGNFEKTPAGMALFFEYLRGKIEGDAARQMARVDRMEQRAAVRNDPKAKLAAKIAKLQAKLAELDSPAAVEKFMADRTKGKAKK